MKKVLIASYDMEVGGVERSLISMLNHFDYTNFNVDLMLYSHTGDFMHLLPKQANVLAEIQDYRTFRMSIKQIFQSGKFAIGISRIMAKIKGNRGNASENGYKQMQYMWKYALPYLPRIEEKYDVAISYLWPHYFVAEKVEARTKIAWIHTDYSTVETDIDLDVQMWKKFDYLIAVSTACKNAFIKKYPGLAEKVVVVENIMSPEFVRQQANETVDNPLVHDERFKIITVARLSHAKGIDQAVEALKRLKDQGYDKIAWYIVGYGGDEELIKKLINRYDLKDSFILLGKKTNPYPFMKAADLYVQPSRYEGKAVTVGEAQILGKPVLITHYPTAKSQVRSEIDGAICELSVGGIAKGIERLYNHPKLRRRLAENCSNTHYGNQEEIDNLYQLIEGGRYVLDKKKSV